MKNKLIILIMILVNVYGYAQVSENAKIVKKFKAGNKESELGLVREQYVVREGLGVGDNYSWNGPSAICFDEKNNFIVLDQKNWKIVVFDSNFEWINDISINSKNDIILPHLIKAYKNGIIVYCNNEYVLFIDWNGQIKWNKRIDDINVEEYLFYYDEDTDLFFHYIKEGICLIIDEDTQIINESINKFFEENKINSLKVKESTLIINNEIVKSFYNEFCCFIGSDFENNIYYVNNGRRILINDNDGNNIGAFRYVEDKYSINRTYFPAVSKTGDIYFLDYTNEKDKINLYFIENTWAPKVKQKWKEYYKNKELTNIHVSDVKKCNDNLRLRKEEATSSAIITIMQKGTKVKILRLGKVETIDGVSSNWVQVEVQSGAKDKDGNPIKHGTAGWCYGGYLE